MSPLRAQGNLVSESEEEPGEKRILSPVEVGSKLNRQFKMDLETAQYFTILYGILNPETRKLRYFSAAHPPALLQRPGESTEILRIESFPVGIIDDPGYSESEIDLASGDRLILYTDGVADALERSDEDNGTERLIDLLNASRQLPLDAAISKVMDEVERRSRASEFPDDNSMLALEIE
jgi:sigma-B regulation protein RsbU (phosphoserine phosphatase)